MSNDRQHRQPGSQTKAAPATFVGAAFTYPLDKLAPISGSHAPCHLVVRRPAVMQLVSPHVIERLSQTRVIFSSGTDVLLKFRLVAGRLPGLPCEGRVIVPSL